jgi:hypothetical protein
MILLILFLEPLEDVYQAGLSSDQTVPRTTRVPPNIDELIKSRTEILEQDKKCFGVENDYNNEFAHLLGNSSVDTRPVYSPTDKRPVYSPDTSNTTTTSAQNQVNVQ